MALIQNIKLIESKLRFVSYIFCSFSFLYSLINVSLKKYIHQLDTNNIYLLIGMVFTSFLIALFINYEITDFFGEDWDWKPKNLREKIENEFFCIVGIGILYYYTQTGAMILFFPTFETITIHSMKLYNILFTVTSVMTYGLYRLTFLKFE